MKKLTLYTFFFSLCTISVAQVLPSTTKTMDKNLNYNNGFLLVQEISNMWDFWESHWENRWNKIYTYDENNNLIEELEEWADAYSKGKRIYHYDEYNRLVELNHQRWDTTHWTNIDKQNYFYDANDNLTEERHYAWWMDGEWHNADKFIHSYDSNNNRVYTLKQNFWNGTSWENEEQFTFTYDSININNLVESLKQDWDGSTWVNSSKTTYFLDANNNITEFWSQYWFEGEWVKTGRSLFTYDNNNNWILSISQHWNGIGWDDNHKDIFNYDANNNKVKWVSQTWFDDDEVSYWLNQIKNTYYYLPEGSKEFVAKNTEIDKPIEDFQTTEDDIIIEPGREDQTLIGVDVLIDEILHTSDSDLEITLSHNDISVTLILQGDAAGENFIQTKMTDNAYDEISDGFAPYSGNFTATNVLSSFLGTDPAGTWTLSIYDGAEGNTGTLQSWGLNLIYSSSSAVEENALNILDIILFPNPAVDEFQVLVSEFWVSQATLELFDLNGRKLLEKQIPNGSEEVTVDVSGFKSGVYFCRLIMENKSVTKKLIIQ